MKLRKRIAALGAAMVMAVSMMSIGASAATSVNWQVTNVNNLVLYNKTIRSNGNSTYRVSCPNFIGQGYSTYIRHCPYYQKTRNGITSNIICASSINYFSTFTETVRKYTNIPVFGQEVHMCFKLNQPSTTTEYKKATGIARTNASY